MKKEKKEEEVERKDDTSWFPRESRFIMCGILKN